MTTDNNLDFQAPVRGGFDEDQGKDGRHRRNWRGLEDFLRSPHIGTAQIRDLAVTNAKIDELAVQDANIENLSVSKLTAGTLSAETTLSAKIKTGDTGQRVEIDQQGIRAYDASGPTVNIPTSGESQFKGDVTAASFNSTTSATLDGTSTIGQGGSLTFASGLTDPSVAPTIAWTYDDTGLTNADAIRGAEYDGTSTQVIACSPTNGWMRGWPVAGGAYNWSLSYTPHRFSASLKPYGVTRLGSYIYASWYCPDFNEIHLIKYSLTSGEPTAIVVETIVPVGSVPTGTFDYLCGATNDATDIWFGYVSTAGDVVVLRYNTSLVYQSTKTLEAAFGTSSRKIYDIEYQNISTAYWYVIWGNNSTGNYTVRAYDNAASPARVSAQDFTLPADSRGIAYTGSAFVTFAYDQQKYRTHTSWTSTSTYVHAKYAWYDTVGTDETKASSQSYISFTARAKLSVSWPTIPAAANRARIYLLENSVTTNPAAGAMWRQSEVTGTSTTFSSYTGSGNADATSNGFPTANPAALHLPQEPGAWTSSLEGQFWYDTDADAPRVDSGSVDLICAAIMSFGGFTWVNLGTGLTDDQAWRVYGTTASAVDTARQGVVLPWDGTVIGISTLSTAAKSAGTASFQVFKNGSALSSDVTWSNSKVASATWAPGTYTFAAGDEIDVRVTTDGSFSPTNLEVEAFLFVARTA